MNIPTPGELDKIAIDQLAIAIMKTVRAHYLRRPAARLTTYEVLNALAIAVAAALAEIDPRQTRDWFESRIDSNLADLAKHKHR
jgi:hypothetical protein